MKPISIKGAILQLIARNHRREKQYDEDPHSPSLMLCIKEMFTHILAGITDDFENLHHNYVVFMKEQFEGLNGSQGPTTNTTTKAQSNPVDSNSMPFVSADVTPQEGTSFKMHNHMFSLKKTFQLNLLIRFLFSLKNFLEDPD